MSNVGLLYVGAVLFVNGLMLLGKIDGKSAGIFNLFVGALQVVFPFYIIATAQGDATMIFSASGIFLFGFTYLYVGITNLTGADGSGVGYYSLWVAILAVGYSIANFFYLGDVMFGFIWLMWAYLWTLFYLLLAKRKPIGEYTGWIAIVQSWITCTIPAFVTMIGIWEITTLTAIILGVGALSFFVLFYLVKKPPTSLNETEKLQSDLGSEKLN
ncbi:AmiS/UreI family transporter [Bacillus sp. FJAT-44742]|uniref:AmiS/UreI family transporter n=1 Tax=Bacillus sp. FJAT-44742 TaxID=2014005 RepID=UPI000C23E055|nr:AmiS/UreI family transporter [Bacillus sp. FJAT-44742]